MNFILGKYILHYTKDALRALKLVVIATVIIVAIIAIKYKPAYAVTVSGETVGYIESEKRLTKKINNFLNNTEGAIAFIEATIKPEYKFMLVSRNTETIDEQVYAKVKDTAVTTYKTYAITVDGEEKTKVDTQAEAEQIVNQVKEGVEEEVNLDLAITEVYENEYHGTTSDDALSTLTVIKEEKIAAYEQAKAEEEARIAAEAAARARAGTVNTSLNVSYENEPIEIALIRPVEGTISSRFGVRSSIRSSVHTGLDIAVSLGTPIRAAASGIVTFGAMKGAYGNLIVISHSESVETYYAHCNSIAVTPGEYVEQGDIIGYVGTTGNSTGPHLHLEVRIDGVAQNPQNYLY